MSKVRTVPRKLAESVTTLYRADGGLNPILSEPVWMGARTEGLEAGGNITMVDSTPSGAAYGEREQLGESWTISFDRIHAINPAGTGPSRDFKLTRGKYVLVVYWASKRHRFWQKETYYGVTAEVVSLRTQGQAIIGQRQVFGARFYIPEEGRLNADGSGGPDPGAPSGSTGTGTALEELCLQFTHLGALVANDYFLGQYQFNDRAVAVNYAKAIGRAPQTTATVLGLEVNGVMTALTLTLPIGAVNAEVSNGGVVSPAVAVPLGGAMRWKVVSGPAAVEDMAHGVSVNMNVV